MLISALPFLTAVVLGPPSVSPVLQQQGGAVAGAVVDDRRVPIPGARVRVEGTNQSATADTRGRFRLENLSAASVLLRVTAIGYGPDTVTARVGNEALEIPLSPSVFQLSEVITTGIAGGEEKRTLGNSVSTIYAGEVQEISPASDLSALINGRASNVVLQAPAGSAGAGGKFRIRGIGSVSLTNDPLLYIYGVRADNATGRGLTFESTSRINDIDPNTIESIEIIKGPAAATLYGTEASAGVIQITTKKGRPGRTLFSFETGQGSSWVKDPEGLFDKTLSWYRDPAGTLKSYSVVRQETDSGRPMFRNGYHQRYAVDVRGGNQGIQYYASGSYDDEEGVVDPNAITSWSGRLNLQAAVAPKLSIAVNGGYVSSRNSIPDVELMRGAYNPFPAFIGTPARGFLTYPPEVSRAALLQIEDLVRITGGVQLNHTPLKWFTHRLNVGVDDVNEELDVIRPFLTGFPARFFSPTTAQGGRALTKREVTLTTVDYAGSATAPLSSSIGTKTSVGLQFYRKFEKTATVTGTRFPAPGVTTVSSAAVRDGNETFVENKTIGIYAQEQISFNDRIFLTAAIRADDNSAFGDDFNIVTYPKVSAAWMVSDESFWGLDFFSTLRLRGAFGKSGQQPDQFAALRSYQAVAGPGGTPAVRPLFVGNPDLGPERGEELELGFEAGLFSDRFGIDFTYFDKKTKDAILARNVPPSLGFPGVQFANIGEVKNTGYELQITGVPVYTPDVRVDLSLAFSHTNNEILDMGGTNNLLAGINQFHRVGFPVGAFFAKKVLSAELGANGQPTNIMCDAGDGNSNPTGEAMPCAAAPTLSIGQPLPDFEGAFSAQVQLFGRLILSGLADFKTGGRNFSADIAIQCAILRLCLANVDPATDVLGAADMTVQPFGIYTTPEVRYLKIRSISASYQMPESWARVIGGTAATITLTGQNIATFTNFNLGPDPELGAVYRGTPHNAEAFQGIPMPFQLMATFRVTF